MRPLQLLQKASVCEDAAALRDPSVQTLEDVRNHTQRRCPLFDRCSSGTLLGPNLRNCIPRMAQDVARYAAQSGGSIESEISDLRRAPVFSKLGFIDPYSDPDPDRTVNDKDEIIGKIRDWATTILGASHADSLDSQIANAHCSRHKEFRKGCPECWGARILIEDATVIVRPNGRAMRVPREQCRCPILNVGDSCPVHGG